MSSFAGSDGGSKTFSISALAGNEARGGEESSSKVPNPHVGSTPSPETQMRKHLRDTSAKSNTNPPCPLLDNISLAMADFTGVCDWGMARTHNFMGCSTSSSDSDTAVEGVKRHFSQVYTGKDETGDIVLDCDAAHATELALLPKVETIQFLVIDDSKIQRRMAERVLSGPLGREVWQVQSVETGEAAIALVSRLVKRPDVLIIDQDLKTAGGRMMGTDVVARLKAQDGWDDTVFIGLTATGQEARDAFIEAGADLVWTKPMPEKFEVQAAIYNFQNKRKQKLHGNAEGEVTPLLKSVEKVTTLSVPTKCAIKGDNSSDTDAS